MNGYEKLIKTMRAEAGRNNNKGYDLKIAVMTSPTSCSLGQMELDSDDLLIAEHLTKKSVIKTDFDIKSSGGSSHTHDWTDKSKFLSPLAEGDVVLIARVSNEKYAIIEKLVEV